VKISERIKKSFEWIVAAFSLMVTTYGVGAYLDLPLDVRGIMVSAVGLAVLIVISSYTITSAIERYSGGIVSEIRALRRSLGSNAGASKSTNPDPPNSGEEEEKEVKTTGVGAFAGMIVGGMLGLPFGPLGVILGGLLGAVMGDQLEYVQLKEKAKEKKKLREES